MNAITTLAQNTDDKTEWLKNELHKLRKHALVLIVIVLSVIGVIAGYYVTSDMFTGPFKKMTYAMMSPSNIELALETTSPMRTKIEYGTSPDYVNQKQVSASYSKTHAVSLDGLLPGKPHMVRFVAEDQTGRLHVSDFYTIK
jgi:hypothetical protein